MEAALGGSFSSVEDDDPSMAAAVTTTGHTPPRESSDETAGVTHAADAERSCRPFMAAAARDAARHVSASDVVLVRFFIERRPFVSFGDGDDG